MQGLDGATIVRISQAVARQRGQDFFKDCTWEEQAEIRKRVIRGLQKNQTQQQIMEQVNFHCPGCGMEFSQDQLKEMQAAMLGMKAQAEARRVQGLTTPDAQNDFETPPEHNAPVGSPEAEENEERNRRELAANKGLPYFKKRSALLAGGAAFERLEVKK